MNERWVVLPGLRVRIEAEADLLGMSETVRDWAESLVRLVEEGERFAALCQANKRADEAKRAAYYDSHRAEVEAWPEVPAPSSEKAKEEPPDEPAGHGADKPTPSLLAGLTHADKLLEPPHRADLGDPDPGEELPEDMPAGMPAPEDLRYPCAECGKEYPSKAARNGHQGTHKRGACQHCGRVFSLTGLGNHEANCNPPRQVQTTSPSAPVAIVYDLTVEKGHCKVCGGWPTRADTGLCEKDYQIEQAYQARADAAGSGAR